MNILARSLQWEGVGTIKNNEMKKQIRIFLCNKCKSSAYTTDGTEPMMCVAPFPVRTSGICGGGYTEITDRVNWIIDAEVDKRITEMQEQHKVQFNDRPNPQDVNPYDSKGYKRTRSKIRL